MPKWIYLSPHLDDVAISCGGLVWQQSQAGDLVEIWTFCAGDPPPGPISPYAQELHARWQTGTEAASSRRQEDRISCQELGVTWRHFSLPDCIYRADSSGIYLYTSDDDLFGDLQPADLGQIDVARDRILNNLDDADRLSGSSANSGRLAQISQEIRIISPLAIGNHVDHQLVRAAAEASVHPLWYYADYPYTNEEPDGIQYLIQTGWRAKTFPLSEAAVLAWGRAVLAHRSQVSSFWSGEAEMWADIRTYQGQMGGVRLWQPPSSGRDETPE